MPALSERRLILTYIFALGLIGVLSLASHFTLDKILRQQKGSAAVVNVAGRQRMLSQRIASLVAQYALGDTTITADLAKSIDAFERSNHDLIAGNPDLHLPAVARDPALRAIYFAGSHPLEAEVSQYVGRARRIAAMSRTDPAFFYETRALFHSARTQLLGDLNAIVTIHERESEDQIAFLDRIQTAMMVVVLATLVFEAVVIFQPMVRRIMHYASELVRLASTDPLTGVLNRRSFFARGAIELERSRRYDRPLTVLMIDADHFKHVNDAFGHDGGDAVLIALTNSLCAGLRTTDILGRIGGEEFAIFLPETDVNDAESLANRLRSHVGMLNVPTNNGPVVFTISIGVAAIAVGTQDLGPVFERADQALYEAKDRGRNRVVVAKPA